VLGFLLSSAANPANTMTEADALYQYSYALERSAGLLQWWVSVSLAFLAFAHVSAKRLNLAIVVALLGLYVVFSAYWVLALTSLFSELAGLSDTLREIASAEGLSPAGERRLAVNDNSRLNAFLLRVSLIGTFLTTIVYVSFCYWRHGLGPHTNRRDEGRNGAA
jgi:hypothetical protein